ncbi:hypothetical protein ACFLYV_04770 [Chloroflexota bacterium]
MFGVFWHWVTKKIAWYRVGILAMVIVAALLGGFLVAASYVDIGVIDVVNGKTEELITPDLRAIPPAVSADAAQMAEKLYGPNGDSYTRFVDQLLATYQVSRGRDVVVLFNSGGWGWNAAYDSSGWQSIIQGISGQLGAQGYDTVVINYRRTSENLWGMVKELFEVTNNYPFKAEALALRLEFTARHLPGMRIILAGESNGTVITDRVMYMLKDNENIFSIQTGTPFWHDPVFPERSLVLNYNGQVVDTFAQGDLGSLLVTTIKGILGLEPPEENPGTVLKFLRAPGHDYGWQYDEVKTRIQGFIRGKFNGIGETGYSPGEQDSG